MLPTPARLRSSADFAATVRGGVAAGEPTVVVHVRRLHSQPELPAVDTKVGFVVPKAVGNAVVRNRVKRQLRHLSAQRLSLTPPGLQLVVRALPAAADRRHDLSGDLSAAWQRALRKLQHRERARSVVR